MLEFFSFLSDNPCRSETPGSRRPLTSAL